MKKIVLHTCCSICFLEPSQRLKEDNFTVIGLFNNPNIQPYSEYLERLDTLNKVVKDNNVTLIVPDIYSLEEYCSFVDKTSNSKKDRCEECYRFRLVKTAELARINEIRYFSTTLLASPYQNYNSILKVSDEISKEYKLTFIYSKKWSENYYKSKNEIKKRGFYIQKYCGCLYSKIERKFSKKSNETKHS